MDIFSMNKELIFFTGVPGSRWSGVSQVFRNAWPDVDNTDCEDPRKVYTHNEFSGHRGNYYGPNDLHGNWLDKEFGTKEQWLNEISRSYNGSKPVKLILSHNFAHYLPELASTFPESKIVLCYYLSDEASYNWWHEAGGWDITYPDYTWYKNNDGMRREIKEQNSKILEFVGSAGIAFEHPDVNFFRKHFNRDIDFVFGKKDVQLAVYG